MSTGPGVVIGLSAVIAAVTEEAPYVVVTGPTTAPGLPFGAFDPLGDRTLELSLRRWVSEQTGFDIGYVEQLYTFGDRGREAPLEDLHADAGEDAPRRVISIGYLALTPQKAPLAEGAAAWRSWYDFFPWEDWREGRPASLDAEVAPRLLAWARKGPPGATRLTRVRHAFGLEGAVWNEERVLERYELLYEANLVPEAARDAARFAGLAHTPAPAQADPVFGVAMTSDHRRILATAVSRLRAKIKYRPIVFQLAPELFTLTGLQRIVESISGLTLHKQNFRRLLDRSGLVEGAGRLDLSSGGRPAELYRVRQDVLRDRPIGGVHVPSPRAE
jgi:hypothetical protein